MVLCSTARILHEKIKLSHIYVKTPGNNESVSDRLLVAKYEQCRLITRNTRSIIICSMVEQGYYLYNWLAIASQLRPCNLDSQQIIQQQQTCGREFTFHYSFCHQRQFDLPVPIHTNSRTSNLLGLTSAVILRSSYALSLRCELCSPQCHCSYEKWEICQQYDWFGCIVFALSESCQVWCIMGGV